MQDEAVRAAAEVGADVRVHVLGPWDASGLAE